MSTAKQPWMKFYPQDWRADERLRMCSLAARGLWMEMLALMHRSEKYGQLLVNGNAPTQCQLAVLVGTSPSELTACLAELGRAGVFSETSSGVLYSRRMARDAKKAKTARENGKNGGNPKLRKQTENPPSDKGRDKGGLNGADKAQKPEARYSVTNVTGGEPPADPVKLLFDQGLALLMEAGSSRSHAGSLIGKWRKNHGDGPVMSAITEARRHAVSAPIEWITKRLAAQLAVSPLDSLIEQAQRYVA